MKLFLKNILLLIVTLTISLGVIEIGFRIFRHDDALRLSMGRVDTKYHHTFQPHSAIHMKSSFPGEYNVTAHINNFGFRGPEMEKEKLEGDKRVFIVGDSFTFGVGAEDTETIPAFLQSKLDPAREHFEFINVGRGNTSPLIDYLRLRDEIPAYSPDAVILMLDFTDLWDDWNFEKNLLYNADGSLKGLNPYYEYGKFKVWNFLRANSVFCSYLHNKLVRTFGKIGKLGLRRYIEIKISGKKAKGEIAKLTANTMDVDSRIFLRGSEKADLIREHFARTAKYILMCRDLAKAQSLPFILVMYPYGVQVGPEQWGKGRTAWGFDAGKVYSDPFSFNLVEQFAKENQIPFINLWPDLLKHAADPLYFPYDGHFTPQANEVVAEALLENPVLKYYLQKPRSAVEGG